MNSMRSPTNFGPRTLAKRSCVTIFPEAENGYGYAGPWLDSSPIFPLRRVDSLGIGSKDYWALGESDIERFHDMFTDDFGKSICSTGKTVVEMVLYGS